MRKVLLSLFATAMAFGTFAETYPLGKAFAYDISPNFHWFNGDNSYAEDCVIINEQGDLSNNPEAIFNINWPYIAMEDAADPATNTGLGMIWFNNRRFSSYEAADEYAPVVESPWTRGSFAIQVKTERWDGFGNIMFALPAMNELCRIRTIFRVDTEDGECTWNNPEKPFLVRLTDIAQEECFQPCTYQEENIRFWEEEGYRVVDQYFQPNGQTYLALTFGPSGLSCSRNIAFYLAEVSCVPVSQIAGDTHTIEGVESYIIEDRPELTVISKDFTPENPFSNKLEIGKSYVFENARYVKHNSFANDGYRYLWDDELGVKMECTKNLFENCVWTVEQGSTENTVYIKNAATGGYLFKNFNDEEDEFYKVTSASPIDIYVFDGTNYENTIGLSTDSYTSLSYHTFLNAAGDKNAPFICGWSFDSGSEWYAHEIAISEPGSLSGIAYEEDEVFCKIGGSVKMRVSKTPFNAQGAITFTSQNPEVATVDSNGVVTGISEGQTEIVATCGSHTTTCIVYVETNVIPVSYISHNEFIGTVGESLTIIVDVHPDDATNKTINWISHNPEVVSVDQDGTVKFIAPGFAFVSAECQDHSLLYSFAVKEVMAEALKVFPVEVEGNIGHEFSLLALHEPENTTDKSVTWESSDPEVASVSEDGRVTLKAPGSANITAHSGGHTATCNVAINDNVYLTEIADSGVIIKIVDDGIVVSNVDAGEIIAVYSVDGKAVNGAIVEQEETHLTLAPGIYIVKVSPNTVAKVLIK